MGLNDRVFGVARGVETLLSLVDLAKVVVLPTNTLKGTTELSGSLLQTDGDVKLRVPEVRAEDVEFSFVPVCHCLKV